MNEQDVERQMELHVNNRASRKEKRFELNPEIEGRGRDMKMRMRMKMMMKPQGWRLTS